MKIEKQTTDDNELILLCKLASDVSFTKEVGSQLSSAIFADDWSAILYGLIESYTRKYNDAAMPMLKKIAKDSAKDIRDADTAKAVVKFASHIQEYYSEHKKSFFDDKYARDSILRWIKERNLSVLANKINNALENGDVDAAEDSLRQYSEVKQVEFTTVDMFSDINKIKLAYEEDDGGLFRLSGDLGNMIGDFKRGDLAFVLGESGTGKSWLTDIHIGMSAVQSGLSVLCLNLENAENQMIRRIYSSITGACKCEKDVRIPRFESIEEDEAGNPSKWRVVFDKKHVNRPNLDSDFMRKFLDSRVMESNGGQFMLESFAPNQLSVSGIKRELDNLREFRNFIPDVLIIDYIDLLRPENRKEERRLQLDNLAIGLRELALERDILILSPTQCNRGGFGRKIKKSDVAGNIGYIFHAAIVIGLYHNEDEKEMGITNVSILKNRDEKESADYCVCLGCMDIGKPIMFTKMSKKVIVPKKNEGEEDDGERETPEDDN